MPKQVDDLFKCCAVGQGVDVEALVTEDSAISIDKTNVRLGGNNALEPRLCHWHWFSSPVLELRHSPGEWRARDMKFYFTGFASVQIGVRGVRGDGVRGDGVRGDCHLWHLR